VGRLKKLRDDRKLPARSPTKNMIHRTLSLRCSMDHQRDALAP